MSPARRILGLPLLALAIACGAPAGGSISPSPSGALSSAIAIPTHLASLGMDAARVQSAAGLVAMLARAGVLCETNTAATLSPGSPARVRCSLGEDDVVGRVFESTDARNRYLAQAGALLGQAQVEPVPQLAGPNWLVSADTMQTIDLIARVVGGEVVR